MRIFLFKIVKYKKINLSLKILYNIKRNLA